MLPALMAPCPLLELPLELTELIVSELPLTSLPVAGLACRALSTHVSMRTGRMLALSRLPFGMSRSEIIASAASSCNLRDRMLTCKDMETLSVASAEGALESCPELHLAGNMLADVGLMSLSEAIARGGFADLTTLR